MIIVTSVNPNSENCISAIKSWHKFGKVYSLNSENELYYANINNELINTENFKEVTFIPTHRIMKWNERSLVSINAMIDLVIEKDEDLLLINSDIIIDHLPEFKNDGITIFSRFDFETIEVQEQMRIQDENSRLYVHGFDAFFIPKHLLKVYPPTIYCLGCCHFDYSIPYRYLINNIPVYWSQERCMFHKMHPFAWNYEEWQMTANFFKLEFKIDEHMDLGQMSNFILNEIKVRSIK